MKQLIRLTEGDLHKIVENSIKKVLTEVNWNDGGHSMSLGDLLMPHRNSSFNKILDAFNSGKVHQTGMIARQCGDNLASSKYLNFIINELENCGINVQGNEKELFRAWKEFYHEWWS